MAKNSSSTDKFIKFEDSLLAELTKVNAPPAKVGGMTIGLYDYQIMS